MFYIKIKTHEHETENNINPSAPLDDMRFISFHQNLYLKITLPEFDMNDYRINRIIIQYKFLDEERKTKNFL
jgi:hypothetical protein